MAITSTLVAASRAVGNRQHLSHGGPHGYTGDPIHLSLCLS